MKIVADDYGASEIMLGGGDCDGYEDKNQYLQWCYDLVQAEKDGNKENEKAFSDKLLCALKAFCIKEIDEMADSDKEREKLKDEGYSDTIIPSMLYTPEKIKKMKDEIDKIWESMELIEDNYTQKVNIVSIQLLSMFTFNLNTSKIPDKDKNALLYLRSLEYTDYNVTRDTFNKYPDTLKCLSGYNDKGLPIYFLICIYNLTVSNILDSLFEHNLWFLGFSSRFLYIDGDWGSPWYYSIHDTEHWEISVAEHEPCYKFVHGANNDINKGFEIIREFYRHCKQYGNNALGYSLKVAIFLAIHEFGQGSDCKIWFSDPTNPTFKDGIIDNYINKKIDRFTNKNDLFELLPRRIKDEVNSGETEEKRQEIVMRYFYDEVVESFVKEYAKFMHERKGGRKTKKCRYKKRCRKSRRKKRKLGKLR